MFTGEMQEVCQKLETVVKNNMYPMGSRTDNMGVIITYWGKLIKNHFDAGNVHMVNNPNASGLEMLQKGITGVKNMVQEVQTTLVQATDQFVENNIEFSSVKSMFTKINTDIRKISKNVRKIGKCYYILFDSFKPSSNFFKYIL